MGPAGLHHVSINVDDVLGLGVRSDRPNFNFGGAWWTLGANRSTFLKDVPRKTWPSTSPWLSRILQPLLPGCAHRDLK